MTIFQILYDVALELLTSPVGSVRYTWTMHHFHDHDAAEELLRASILQDTMPGENARSSWGIIRIFMFNLVNRAQAPMTRDHLAALLTSVEKDCSSDDTEERCKLLRTRLQDNHRLSASLTAFLDTGHVPDGAASFTAWLQGLTEYYATLGVDDLHDDEIIGHISAIAKAIPNMGIALAANLLADLGIKASAKPDLHVMPMIRGLYPDEKMNNRAIIKAIVHMARKEAPQLRAMDRFQWLNDQGGLYPRHIDRLIYLIGSDNFRLGGVKKSVKAPQRRQWMLDAMLVTQRAAAHEIATPAISDHNRQTSGSTIGQQDSHMNDKLKNEIMESLSVSQKACVSAMESVYHEDIYEGLALYTHTTETGRGDLRIASNQFPGNRRNCLVISQQKNGRLHFKTAELPLMVENLASKYDVEVAFRKGNGPLATSLTLDVTQAGAAAFCSDLTRASINKLK